MQGSGDGGWRHDTGMVAHTGGTGPGRPLEFMGQPASSIGEPPIAVRFCLNKPKLDGCRGSGETKGYLMQKWPMGGQARKLVSPSMESYTDSLVGFYASLSTPLIYEEETKQKQTSKPSQTPKVL